MKPRTLIKIQLGCDLLCLIIFIIIGIKDVDAGYLTASIWVTIAMFEHWRNFNRY